MFTTFDKSIAGFVVSWIANECMAYFHVALPADLQTALAALIVAVLVWVTPNVEKALAKDPRGVNPGVKVGAILALVFGASMLLPAQSRAADVLKAPKLALPTFAPCTLTDCTGPYIGFNLAGIATNANVLAGGINGSLAAGGQNIGIQAGYQFWRNSWFFGPEVGADYTYGGTIVPGAGVPKWLTYEIVKFGTPISTFFGGITPANATGLPAILVNSTLSPYLFIGAAQRNWGTGLTSGGGITFMIPDIAASGPTPASGHWFLDARYMNIQYTGGNQVTPTTSVPQENIILVGLNYKF